MFNFDDMFEFKPKKFVIKCKCLESECVWVKQEPISLDVTNFQLGWHVVEKLTCISKYGKPITTQEPEKTTQPLRGECKELPNVRIKTSFISSLKFKPEIFSDKKMNTCKVKLALK